MARLYVTDLDDTFLTKDTEVSPFSRDMINRLIGQGAMFSVATARLMTQAKEILQGLDLRLPVVLGNGAVVYDIGENKILFARFLPEELHEGLFAYCKGHDLPLFVMAVDCENTDKLVYNPKDLNPVMARYFQRYPDGAGRYVQRDDFHHLGMRGIVKLRSLGEREVLAKAQREIEERFAVKTYLTREVGENGAYYALEINHPQVSKYEGIQVVKELSGAKELVCFGDEANDIPMFQGADFSYAVAEAIDELKAIATGVIGSHNEDAVAKFVAGDFAKEK